MPGSGEESRFTPGHHGCPRLEEVLGSLCLVQETFRDDGTFLILYHDDDQATGSRH